MDKPEPTDTHYARYRAVVERLPSFLDRGWVVSKENGEFVHQGDSLLFSGLAMYALSCQDGQPIADALTKMLVDKDGGAYRHPDQEKREISLDGLLGLYRGITKRVVDCGEKDLWADVLKNHKARVASDLPAEFNLVADALTYELGLSPAPDKKRMSMLAFELMTWVKIVKATKAACYRVHLSTIALQTLEHLGYSLSDDDYKAFSSATDGLDMPTTDHWCGRPSLDTFLSNFEYNKWQYRHQRCLKWEIPDGMGQEHPGIDYLVAYADLYGSPK